MPVKCRHEGCNKVPSFNLPDVKPAIFCMTHKTIDMVNVKTPYSMRKIRTCISKECDKVPRFNYIGQEKKLYCSKHKLEGMVNLYKKICAEKCCENYATYNKPTENKPLYCKLHKEDDMIELCHRRCAEKDCNKLPCQNNKGTTNPLYCATHKKDDMVNVVNKHCIQEGCEKFASFNFPGTNSRIQCKDHKKDGMTILSGIYCNEPNCGKIANQNYRNKKRGMQCLAHKKDNMIDVKNKLCLTPFCETICTNKQKNYCFRCFVHLFPESEITRNQKTKEASVTSHLKAVFPNYTFDLDKRVSGGCSKRRPDCLLHLGNKVIIVEVDEEKHTNPNQETICENKRMMEISQDLSFCPIIFIRFNPDSQVDVEGITHKSCWKINKRGLCVVNKKLEEEWTARLHALQQKVQQWIDNETTKTIEINHLFQDAIDAM